MQTVLQRSGSERGAILVHVAVALLMLVALSAFTVDRGMYWVGRGQSQNSADAGAIAGAIALAYDSATDTSDTGPAKLSAWTTARANLVVDKLPAIDVSDDITFVDCPDGTPAPACIRVDVYRDLEHGNALPTWFGNLVGVTSQDTRATATAEAGGANATNCLRPWMVPDKWSEKSAPANTFNGADVYTTPDPDTGLGGTGYTVKNDYGTVITLHPGDPHDAIAPSDFYDINLADSSGGHDYRNNIVKCTQQTQAIGDVVQTLPGHDVGNTRLGVQELIALDRNARWDPDKKEIVDSAYAVSPRSVPVALFSPAEFMGLDRRSGVIDLHIVNILGFFVQTLNGKDIQGVLISTPGELIAGPAVGPAASFIKYIQLVR
jgi:Putative Flp pilus-assembly TadE/G-like